MGIGFSMVGRVSEQDGELCDSGWGGQQRLHLLGHRRQASLHSLFLLLRFGHFIYQGNKRQLPKVCLVQSCSHLPSSVFLFNSLTFTKLKKKKKKDFQWSVKIHCKLLSTCLASLLSSSPPQPVLRMCCFLSLQCSGWSGPIPALLPRL